MYSITVVSAVCLIIYFGLYRLFSADGELSPGKAEPVHWGGLVLTVCLSGIFHFICAKSYYGHETDMGCFSGWASMVYEGGFGSFYTSEAFTDYPPGYMYVLYVIGYLKTIIGNSKVLIKLPAMAADILTGVIIYFAAKKRFPHKGALMLSSFFLLSPAIVLNSALWGQVDSIYTLFAALAVLLVCGKRLIASYFVFALAVFIKPQALIFTPVLLLAAGEDVFMDFNPKKLLVHLVSGIAAIGVILLLSIPFGVVEVLKQYAGTLSSYKYATVNAFNLYGALNLNWFPLNNALSLIGWIFIAAVVAYVLIYFIKGCRNYFFLAGVLAFATFMLSTKMHDRYAYPAMLFFLCAYISKPQKESMYMFILITFSQLVNTAWVLMVYNNDINLYARSPFIIVFSVINLLIFAYMLYACHRIWAAQNEEAAEAAAEINVPRIFRSRKSVGLTGKDYILIAVLCVVYGAVSFYDLGDRSAPQSFYDLAEGPVSIDMDSPEYIDKLVIYPSCNDINEDRKLTVSYTDENGAEGSTVLEDCSVFSWNFIDFGKTVTNITLSTDYERLMIMEAGLIGENGPLEITSDNPIFDEQTLIPERRTYKNSTYFDEIYHARTGYEFVQGFSVYEWTHPPLGKAFIAAGIRLFGMTPFGWRFAGNVFGILMIPLFYALAKKLFKVTHIAFLTTVLFTFDFMHFVQTRISTVDVYGTFFIMLMYLFMYRYYQMSFYDLPLCKTFPPLLLTGIAFGLGAASKWTAIYACAGIAVLFFAVMLVRYNEYYARRSCGGERLDFAGNFAATGIFCVLVFIIIPACIYALSYLPYLGTENTHGIRTVIDNQRDMFVYHSKTVLGSEHPYASRWYTWPVMVRPIFYYSGTVSDTVREGISAFGNPAVWWVGIGAVILNVFFTVIYRDRKSAFLLVGYLSCLLPWIPIERTTYIYHYFPCVPFMVLMIGHCFEKLYYRHSRAEKKIFICYAAAAVLLFIMFYPVLSGHGAEVNYVDKVLRWFDSWVLVLD